MEQISCPYFGICAAYRVGSSDSQQKKNFQTSEEEIVLSSFEFESSEDSDDLVVFILKSENLQTISLTQFEYLKTIHIYFEKKHASTPMHVVHIM